MTLLVVFSVGLTVGAFAFGLLVKAVKDIRCDKRCYHDARIDVARGADHLRRLDDLVDAITADQAETIDRLVDTNTALERQLDRLTIQGADT